MNNTVSKSLVRTMYDVQHERIQTGNRICAEIKARLGQKPGQSEEELEDEARDFLGRARAEYARITDAFVLNQAHKYLKVDFSEYEIITDAGLLVFVELYEEQLSHEQKMTKVIAKIVQQHDLWGAFLEQVRGCGPLMSAVILSEFDIHKAVRPSQFWRYAGLDVVTKWHLQGTSVLQVNLSKGQPTLDLPYEVEGIIVDEEHCTIPGGTFMGKTSNIEDTAVNPPESDKARDMREIAVVRFERDGYVIDATYRLYSYGGRSRRKEHLVEQEYTDKGGKPQTKMGLGFNPFLKTKLVGVLASSFLKQPAESCKYRQVYDEYKHRLENHPDHVEKSKGHRHAMAMRYCVKMFLLDLWMAWRTLENLPVTASYHEAVLGHKHHDEGA